MRIFLVAVVVADVVRQCSEEEEMLLAEVVVAQF